MSQIVVAVTSFIVHRLGPNPTTTLFPKLQDVFTWVFTDGGQSKKEKCDCSFSSSLKTDSEVM